jgi:hypothetical protein
MLKNIPADESTAQIEESLMNVISPLITNPQSAVAVQPCACALYYPAIAPKPLAAVEPAARYPWLDAPPAKRTAQGPRVISLIRMQLLRPPARAPRRAPSDRLDSVNRLKHHPRVVHVGGRGPHRERDAFGLDHKMALRARFASIRRIPAGFLPPFGAGTVNESIEALDQSSWSESARRSSNIWCSLCHTPASCHSRSLRQHVTPEPQPISLGSHDQGRLARSTKMMPRKQSRFDMRGLPPLGFSGSGGSSGSTTAQSSSLTMGFAIMSDFTNSQLTC